MSETATEKPVNWRKLRPWVCTTCRVKGDKDNLECFSNVRIAAFTECLSLIQDGEFEIEGRDSSTMDVVNAETLKAHIQGRIEATELGA